MQPFNDQNKNDLFFSSDSARKKGKFHYTLEPLYNEVLGIRNDFLFPSNSEIYEKNLDITKPRYSEQILPAP